MNTNYPQHKESFEVVLIRHGVSELGATPTDLQRIFIEAADPLSAQLSDAVQSVKGWRPICATKPGVLTETEIMARRRELSFDMDKSKL